MREYEFSIMKIWFSSPHFKNDSTKVENQFLKLINKHFPQHHKFYNLLNTNNVKVSYNCIPNTKNIINTHKLKNNQPSKR